jgi:type VI secretion system protein ImpC
VSHDRSEVHLAADLSAPPARALEPGEFRVAIVGDFSGRTQGGARAPGGRRTWRVDVDDLETVLSRIAPELHITLDPSEAPIAVTFRSLDDFHPDRLLERLTFFQRLIALARGTAEQQPPAAAPPLRRAQQPDAVALDLGAGSLLDRIVDGTQADTTTKQAAPRDDLSDFVARAVRSHVVSEPTAQQREAMASVHAVTVAAMRVLLHDPQFQALESLWRGVDFLVRRLETSESMQVHLVDLTRDELVADLGAADITRTTTHRLLVDAAGQRSMWSLLVGAYTFEPRDAELLARLAGLARAAGAPWVVAGHSSFMGVASFADSDPDDWTPERSASWDALRRSDDAAYLSLAAPRFLVRLPYGKRGEECETFSFEELGSDPPEHESFLWANAAFAVALVLAESVASRGTPTGSGSIDRLPLYVAPVDGEPTATPCGEVVMTQRALEELLDAGITAVASRRDDDTTLIPRVQSVANPPRSLAIRRSVT